MKFILIFMLIILVSVPVMAFFGADEFGSGPFGEGGTELVGPANGSGLLLDDGVSFLMLDDGTSFLLLSE